MFEGDAFVLVDLVGRALWVWRFDVLGDAAEYGHDYYAVGVVVGAWYCVGDDFVVGYEGEAHDGFEVAAGSGVDGG